MDRNFTSETKQRLNHSSRSQLSIGRFCCQSTVSALLLASFTASLSHSSLSGSLTEQGTCLCPAYRVRAQKPRPPTVM